MDVVPLGNSVSGLFCWGHRSGQTLSIQPAGAPSARPSPGLLLVNTGSLISFSYSSYPQRPGSFLKHFKRMPWTRSKRSKPSFLLLASACTAASRSWFGFAKKRLQTGFGLARWLRKWPNDPHITDKNCITSYGTYRGRHLGSWPWTCLQIYPLKLGETSRKSDPYFFACIRQCQKPRVMEPEGVQ